MKTLKKTFVGAFIFAIMCLLTFTTISVNAAKVHISKDPNVGGVQILSLSDEEYYINIDDESGYGYVVSAINNDEEILGSCSVVIVNSDNSEGYTLCFEDTSLLSYGTLVIVITDYVENEGIVYSVSGQLENIFSANDKVVIAE